MNRTVTQFAATALLLVSASLPAWALDDAAFAVGTVTASLQDIQMGQLAQQKAQNPQVKALGDTVVKDQLAVHQKAGALAAKLEQYAPTVLPAEGMQIVRQLTAATGADFDRRFIEELVGAHTKSVVALAEAGTSANADVKAFAAETLAVVRSELTAAQALKR